MAYCQVVVSGCSSQSPTTFTFLVDIGACDDQGVSFNIEQIAIDVAVAASSNQQLTDIREAARLMIIDMGGPDVPANQIKVF